MSDLIRHRNDQTCRWHALDSLGGMSEICIDFLRSDLHSDTDDGFKKWQKRLTNLAVYFWKKILMGVWGGDWCWQCRFWWCLISAVMSFSHGWWDLQKRRLSEDETIILWKKTTKVIGFFNYETSLFLNEVKKHLLKIVVVKNVVHFKAVKSRWYLAGD